MIKGKLEKELVEPYLPDKIVPPEYIREVLQEATDDFPLTDFEYVVPHNMTSEKYVERYEELEQHMVEILNWRLRWFGKAKSLEKQGTK